MKFRPELPSNSAKKGFCDIPQIQRHELKLIFVKNTFYPISRHIIYLLIFCCPMLSCLNSKLSFDDACHDRNSIHFAGCKCTLFMINTEQFHCGNWYTIFQYAFNVASVVLCFVPFLSVLLTVKNKNNNQPNPNKI